MKKKIIIILTVVLVLVLVYLAYSLFFVFKFKGFQNGRIVHEQYFCSDVCPNYGRYYLLYYGIKTKEECADIGGVPEIDPAWHGFIGCAPAQK
jgi:hypothetical protein